MPKITTTNFKVHVVDQLYESLTEPQNSFYYIFAGRPEAWDSDSAPPEPEDSQSQRVFDVFDTMIYGKQVTQDDASYMVPRYDWTSNTVYAMFDDEDATLMSNNFFVVVDANTSYHVFKCLNNNFGAESLVAPNRNDTSEDDEFYLTSDGYQWKFLYSIPSSTFRKFATDEWIPVVENANTVANSTPGAIDVIVVESPGTQFNSYANGVFSEIAVDGDATIYGIDSTSSANTDFFKECAIKIVTGQGAGQQRRIAEYSVQGGFKRVYLDQAFVILPNTSSTYEITPHVSIVGDGANCVARAIVDSTSNTISSIEITERGTGYTYATAEVRGNTGIIVANNVQIANNAVIRPIIGPPRGHGSDVYTELGATGLGFSVTFANTEQLTIPATGKFRQIGLIRDPLFANVELSLANTIGTFADEETVILTTNENIKGTTTFYNEASSILRLTDVKGGFVANGNVRGLTSNATAVISSIDINGATKSFVTFDQRMRLDTSFNGTPAFTDGEFVEQEGTDGSGVVHESNTTFTALTQTRGTINITDGLTSQTLSSNTASANVNAIVLPDLKKASGEVLYIENVQPITRADNLSETVKFIIRF